MLRPQSEYISEIFVLSAKLDDFKDDDQPDISIKEE
jgi:hypothetical protein